MTTVGGSIRPVRILVGVTCVAAMIGFSFAAYAANVPSSADSSSTDRAAAVLYEKSSDTTSTSTASNAPSASAPASSATPAATVPAGAASSGVSGASEAPAPSPGASPTPTSMMVTIPESMPPPPYIQQASKLPPATTEIPQAIPGMESQSPPSSSASSGGDEQQTTIANPDGQIINYERAQNPQLFDPQLRSLQQFMQEMGGTSALGMQVQEATRKLNSGREVTGLLVVDVTKGSPAAKAGLQACTRTARNVLEGVAVAASMFFPPAVLAVPLLDQVRIDETYDLIIGVDGTRVTNFLDFEDKMSDVQPGEIVYLNVVHDGTRMLVPVKVPSDMAAGF